jgi:hypothetical protein
MHELPDAAQAQGGRLLCLLLLWNGSLPADPAWWRQGRLLLMMLRLPVMKCMGIKKHVKAAK